MVEEKYKYGKPITKPPKGRKRLPQYDECLREFLSSKSNYWEVDASALPTSNIMVVLSSLRWRVKNNSEYKKIRVIMRDKKIILEKVKE
jgi:hypothetical protein